VPELKAVMVPDMTFSPVLSATLIVCPILNSLPVSTRVKDLDPVPMVKLVNEVADVPAEFCADAALAAALDA